MLPATNRPPDIVLLTKWNAVVSGREDCNFCVSSPSKLTSRELADHSVCTTVRCPPLWILLSTVPVFWLWLTELDHVLNQPNKRSTGDRIEWQQQIENLLVLKAGAS